MTVCYALAALLGVGAAVAVAATRTRDRYIIRALRRGIAQLERDYSGEVRYAVRLERIVERYEIRMGRRPAQHWRPRARAPRAGEPLILLAAGAEAMVTAPSTAELLEWGWLRRTAPGLVGTA